MRIYVTCILAKTDLFWPRWFDSFPSNLRFQTILPELGMLQLSFGAAPDFRFERGRPGYARVP